MGFADQQLQIQVPYSPDDTFNALNSSSIRRFHRLLRRWRIVVM